MSRDPIGEEGGGHLYLFAFNQLLGRIDARGLTSITLSPIMEVESLPGDRVGYIMPDPVHVNSFSDYTTEPTTAGCAGGKKQHKTLSESVEVWKITIIGPKKDVETTRNHERTWLEHEKAHFVVVKFFGEWKDKRIHRAADKCACLPCHTALAKYIIAIKNTARVWTDRDNAKIDCDDYDQGWCVKQAALDNKLITALMSLSDAEGLVKDACAAEGISP